jgi:hypothetical protein
LPDNHWVLRAYIQQSGSPFLSSSFFLCFLIFRFTRKEMKQGLGALLRPSSPRQKAKKKKTSGRRCAVIIIMKKKKKEKKQEKKERNKIPNSRKRGKKNDANDERPQQPGNSGMGGG